MSSTGWRKFTSCTWTQLSLCTTLVPPVQVLLVVKVVLVVVLWIAILVSVVVVVVWVVVDLISGT